MSQQKSLVTTITIERVTELTLDELCAACQVTPELIYDAVAYNILEPIERQGHWYFNAFHLKRTRILLHLLQDLEVNLAGAALAIDLIDEIEALRERMAILDRYFKTRNY